MLTSYRVQISLRYRYKILEYLSERCIHNQCMYLCASLKASDDFINV